VRHSPDIKTVRLEGMRNFFAAARRRLASEDAFTLVELTIVLLIMGILLTIAVPSYLSFKDKANKTAAQADVKTAMKSVIAYGADNFPNAQNDPDSTFSTSDSGYDNISLTYLATKYDASIPTTPGAPYVVNPAGFAASTTDFCLTAAVGRWIAVQHGPGTGVQVGTLFTPGTCTVS
jgi:prepilin-type N-terminal cleavage/methylation domain-containing protein